ncbi:MULTISPECIES: ImmA/IrrE family metallo-endopeptidase [unclassified Actinobaculum]|uniref:ImmA/IrrE family metallo-endopeptidase n=1 Tax=unclassified Actinobaculum TaxID=2609299 RepID=UPI000D529559|nr:MULTISPECIES: ImmA/IrrE family metallo-endopeptidase [unclassified Actinobaculum]AWE41557.1 hypothetical protein DDD63_00855 [Actinobaculum sp. 313]RTE48009.1 ImmA/IrrE family metallo-endopeptidase [Actinobaculum sp. 352]
MLIKDRARDEAEQARAKYWDGVFPVDPVKIAVALGMNVYTAVLPEGESGRIVKEQGKPAEIYLAVDEPDRRQNYTCAHELGHWFERRIQEDDEYSFVDHRDDSQPKDAHEWFAEWFAAYLLMPTKEFIDAVDDGLTVDRLTRRFGVTPTAARNRARNLGVSIDRG